MRSIDPRTKRDRSPAGIESGTVVPEAAFDVHEPLPRRAPVEPEEAGHASCQSLPLLLERPLPGQRIPLHPRVEHPPRHLRRQGLPWLQARGPAGESGAMCAIEHLERRVQHRPEGHRIHIADGSRRPGSMEVKQALEQEPLRAFEQHSERRSRDRLARGEPRDQLVGNLGANQTIHRSRRVRRRERPQPSDIQRTTGCPGARHAAEVGGPIQPGRWRHRVVASPAPTVPARRLEGGPPKGGGVRHHLRPTTRRPDIRAPERGRDLEEKEGRLAIRAVERAPWSGEHQPTGDVADESVEKLKLQPGPVLRIQQGRREPTSGRLGQGGVVAGHARKRALAQPEQAHRTEGQGSRRGDGADKDSRLAVSAGGHAQRVQRILEHRERVETGERLGCLARDCVHHLLKQRRHARTRAGQEDMLLEECAKRGPDRGKRLAGHDRRHDLVERIQRRQERTEQHRQTATFAGLFVLVHVRVAGRRERRQQGLQRLEPGPRPTGPRPRSPGHLEAATHGTQAGREQVRLGSGQMPPFGRTETQVGENRREGLDLEVSAQGADDGQHPERPCLAQERQAASHVHRQDGLAASRRGGSAGSRSTEVVGDHAREWIEMRHDDGDLGERHPLVENQPPHPVPSGLQLRLDSGVLLELDAAVRSEAVARGRPDPASPARRCWPEECPARVVGRPALRKTLAEATAPARSCRPGASRDAAPVPRGPVEPEPAR